MSQELDKIKKKIQANILRSHGRNHALCLFIQFGDRGRLGIKRWIAYFMNKYVMSGQMQFEDSIKYNEAKTTGKNYVGSLVSCLFLSAEGFRELGFKAYRMPEDPIFHAGMKNKFFMSEKEEKDVGLNDPDPTEWETSYQKEDGKEENIHAMILLAHDEEKVLLEYENEIGKLLQRKNTGHILFVEEGVVLRRDGNPVEHFGYRDGISKADIFDNNGEFDVEKIKQKVIDNNIGSYLVFRKLEQNVLSFNRRVKTLAQKVGISEKLAGAQVIGRFKNGIPLTLSGNDKIGDLSFQPKQLESDRDGKRCPLHAHIRKVNPRKNSNNVDITILRRGITYGRRALDLSDQPRKGVGLLFMCYQKSVEHQFVKMQSMQCNNFKFPTLSKNVGIDPLVGQQKKERNLDHQWYKEWNKSKSPKESQYFNGDVTFRGGEYFYAPNKSFLKNYLEYNSAPIYYSY